SVYVCLETELWPNLLLQLQRCRVPAILLNGRLSERSFRRYRLIRGFMAKVLACFARIAVIREEDAKRYIGLGAAPQRVSVLGNAKYALAIDTSPDTADRYRQWLGLTDDQPLLVAGSTHGGEEAMLLETLRAAKTKIPSLVLALTPRHLERLAEVESLLKTRDLPFDRLSSCKSRGRRSDIVLVDTMGELTGLYGAATFIFCGGSLVPRGGHNLMEAAIWGKPVCYGPNMKDFLDAKELLEAAGAGFLVASPQELADTICTFTNHPDQYREAGRRARETALTQQGSAKRQVQLIKELLNCYCGTTARTPSGRSSHQPENNRNAQA
ncbi:MAG: 3-deoxy-D-manno-octulosonic acid transferase, partial [Desulfobulbaceae bacterium]|nr:3-deoxy-D-manno-octulosonic acid transferase [Desulfobulbaceae bacterium]